MRFLPALVVIFSMSLGCSSLADHAGDAGDVNAPNARLGPFRALAQAELGNSRVAPFVLRDDDSLVRDLSVITAADAAEPLASFAYAARVDPDGPNAGDIGAASEQLVLVQARDGRSFARSEQLVLSASEPWEGGQLGAPAALRIDGEVWLYYAAAGGIGLAKGDGAVFTREGSGPVLTAVMGGWERGRPPHSPTVQRRGGDDWVMFYAVDRNASDGGPAVGEAVSFDGVMWTRVGAAPALPPGAVEDIDARGAASPCLLLVTSPQGRRSEQLYYSATDAQGLSRVALAARFEGNGNFVRAASPMFGGDADATLSQPWVVQHDGFTLLFATLIGDGQSFPAVTAGVAPATAVLPVPVDP